MDESDYLPADYTPYDPSAYSGAVDPSFSFLNDPSFNTTFDPSLFDQLNAYSTATDPLNTGLDTTSSAWLNDLIGGITPTAAIDATAPLNTTDPYSASISSSNPLNNGMSVTGVPSNTFGGVVSSPYPMSTVKSDGTLQVNDPATGNMTLINPSSMLDNNAIIPVGYNVGDVGNGQLGLTDPNGGLLGTYGTDGTFTPSSWLNSNFASTPGGSGVLSSGSTGSGFKGTLSAGAGSGGGGSGTGQKTQAQQTLATGQTIAQILQAILGHGRTPPKPMDSKGSTAMSWHRFAKGGSTGSGTQKQGALGMLVGNSGGQDDDVAAKLSHGEYVMDADSVSALGDGNNEAGAAKLDEMRYNLRKHKRSAPADSIPPKAKSPLAYMKGAK